MTSTGNKQPAKHSGYNFFAGLTVFTIPNVLAILYEPKPGKVCPVNTYIKSRNLLESSIDLTFYAIHTLHVRFRNKRNNEYKHDNDSDKTRQTKAQRTS